jgi:hypothetical protein
LISLSDFSHSLSLDASRDSVFRKMLFLIRVDATARPRQFHR